MSFRSKVVIRKLPPTLEASQLEGLLAPWRQCINYAILHPGKVPPTYSARAQVSDLISLFIRASGKKPRAAMAIVNFTDPQVLLQCVQTLTSSPFVDARGVEHPLLVEFASYQVVPPPLAPPPFSKDPLCGTLDGDDDYQKFLQDLEMTEKQQQNATSLEAQLEALFLREKELFPWKYDKNYVRRTALLDHLNEIAQARSKPAGNNGQAKSKKSKRKKAKNPKATESEQRNHVAESLPPVSSKPVAFKILSKSKALEPPTTTQLPVEPLTRGEKEKTRQVNEAKESDRRAIEKPKKKRSNPNKASQSRSGPTQLSTERGSGSAPSEPLLSKHVRCIKTSAFSAASANGSLSFSAVNDAHSLPSTIDAGPKSKPSVKRTDKPTTTVPSESPVTNNPSGAPKVFYTVRSTQ